MSDEKLINVPSYSDLDIDRDLKVDLTAGGLDLDLSNLSGVLRVSGGNAYAGSTMDHVLDGSIYARVRNTELSSGVYKNASIVVKGIAKFNSANFTVTEGEVSLVAGGGQVHSSLSGLDYASAGHIGFEPTVTKGNLTAGSTKISIGGGGTNALIGSGASIDVVEANINHNLLLNTHNLTTDINHDSLTNFVANEHTDHSGVSVIAGTGMSGGGNITASRTLNCTITQYTDELTQDAIGGALVDSSSIDFTYDDNANTITAVVLPAGVNHNSLLNVHQNVNTTAAPTFAGLTIGGASKLANNTVIDPDTCGGYVVAGTINDGGSWNVTLAIGGGGLVNGLSWGLGVSDSFYFGLGDGANQNSMQSFMAAYTTRNIQLVPISGRCVVGAMNMIASYGRLDVSQPTTDFAQSVMTLRQEDVSEEFIRFVGTAASEVLTQSFVKAGDVSVATLAGYLKIFVDDVGNQITDQAYFVPFYTLT